MVNIDYDVKSFVANAADIDKELKEKRLNSTITKDKVRAYLQRVFKKCVFYEIKGNHDIEHYRPKGAVKTIRYHENEKIYKTVAVKDKKDDEHPGYEWLTNEISNLLWVCRDCNAGKGAKRNRFPIEVEEQRIFNHSANLEDLRIDSKFLQQEKPLLLNPLIDTPEDHLKINHFGQLIPVNNSKKGEITIEVCNLNRYSLLIERRKKIIDEFFHKLLCQAIKLIVIIKLLIKYLERIDYKINYKIINMLYFLSFEGLFAEIEKNKKKDSEFSRVYYAIYSEFEEFLDNYLNNNTLLDIDNKTSIKEFLTKAFNILEFSKKIFPV